MRRKPAVPLRAALGVAALAAAGCTRMLDMEALRQSVRAGVGEQMRLEVAEVECPESREAKVADAFECTVTTAGGATLSIEMLQSADADVSWRIGHTRGLLDREKLAAEIRAGILAQAGVEARVDCGLGFGDTPPGQSFECHATRADQQSERVIVTVRDRDGSVDWSLSGAPAQPSS